MSDLDDAERRTLLYLAARNLTIDKELGRGNDGIVWMTAQSTAVKVLYRQENFIREFSCYLRLHERNVRTIKGFNLPQLVHVDEDLWIIEMDVVNPPYIIDFGKAKVDYTPDFSDEVMEDLDAEIVEWWGDDAQTIRSILAVLKYHGIYYADPRPGNIRLPRDG